MKRRDEVLVGMVATAALVMGLLGALWLARGGLFPGYPLHAKFPWGAGLRQGQPVLLAGVTVGYVAKVDIQSDGFLIVDIRVQKQYKVPRGTTASIAPNGFFGDMLVALYPGRPTRDFLAAGDTIPAGVPAPSIGAVLSRVDTLATNLTALSGALRKQLVDEGGLKEIRATIANANRVFSEIQTMAREQNEELKRTQGAFRKAMSAVDSAKIDSVLTVLRDAGAAVKALSTEIKSTTSHVDSLITKATTGGGSLAKLLNDPGLYEDLRKSIQRLDSLMTEFQANPRKFIKLSIF